MTKSEMFSALFGECEDPRDLVAALRAAGARNVETRHPDPLSTTYVWEFSDGSRTLETEYDASCSDPMDYQQGDDDDSAFDADGKFKGASFFEKKGV